ncbi:MAG: alpha/beta hydrolase, partial [Anderseniella sp.]|nr:alpha/beta hydrolase [Anderseniella sp.]
PTAEPSEAEESDSEEAAEEAAEAGDASTVIADEQLELMAAIAPPPQLSDRELGVHPGPCLPGVSPGDNLVEGEDYTCGTFTVPQNWEEPDGRNLDLSFVVVQATGENPEPDPLLFLNGGPGESAILSVDTTVKKYQELQPERDIILFDTRGLGLSQRLGFEECLVLALQNGAPAEQIAALQVAVPNLLTKVRGETAVYQPTPEELDFPGLNAICWEQFTAQGLDLNQFSTAAYARDAVELIKALGYESFNIDSVSYGTRHAMTIMNNIPSYDDAPQLRSVVLDSAFPPSVYLIRTMVRSDHDFLPQLLAECQADAACNEAYPNLSERLATLLNGLEEAPLEVNGETVTLEDVVQQLRDIGEQRAAYLPKMIAELEMGVLDTYLALRDGEVGTGPVEALPATMEAEDLDLNDPVQAFVAAGLDLLSPEEASIFPIYIQFLMAEEDPLAALPEFIAETYTDETADQMLALSATLTAEDFANSSYGSQIQADAAAASDPEAQLVSMRKANAQGTARLLYSSIHCIDDILNESFEDAVNSYNSLAFPQLTNLDKSQAFANSCQNWLVDPAPTEVKSPVTSDVPALILQGDYDKATPVYMGQTAESELENSTFVLIPQQGHGTWSSAKSCVSQIATAFVQDPETELDLSCLDARKPKWALPDGSATSQ